MPTIINTSQGDVSLPFKAQNVQESAMTMLVNLDGQYMPVEKERKVNKVLGHVVVPAAVRDSPGQKQITKKEYDMLDPKALEMFSRTISIVADK